MPLNETSGNVTADAYAGGVAVLPKYIEDYFSTYLYTGNGANRSINNGIDLSTKGGMTWFKCRNVSGINNLLFDTSRNVGNFLRSDTTNAQTTASDTLTAFNTDGFSLGVDSNDWGTNFSSSRNYVSWSFAKAPKFFDVVTFTANADGSATVNHNLGSVPGCVISKLTDRASDWYVTHRSLSSGEYLKLNTTGTSSTYAGFQVATSTQITYSAASWVPNCVGVIYIYAHNAGGFGLTGTDNVISCGSLTTSGTAGLNYVTLGYEPQFVMLKRTNGAENWLVLDVMRAMSNNSYAELYPNTSGAESYNTNYSDVVPTATGFALNTNTAGTPVTNGNYIYIAIRRGPMKVPTVGTSVFAPVTGNFSSPYTVTTNFPVDLTISSRTAGATRAVNDRLRGGTTNSYVYLNTATTAAESTGTGAGLGFDNNTAVIDVNWQTGGNALWWNFQRAPSFFDEVCYTGTGSATTFNHNLGAVPELMIFKKRSGASNWSVYSKSLSATDLLYLSYTNGAGTDTTVWNSTAPTSSVFSVGTSGAVNTSGGTYVAYLFATATGVSKVGSYTGNGTTQTINCGFTAGARFVLIKRTDAAGDWWVWDSARGMVSGTDYRIDLNAGNSQTNANWVYTATTGFQIVTTDASVNASGGSYIYLAVA